MNGNAEEWFGLGVRPRVRRGFTWSGLLWSLVYPRRAHRTMPTMAGTVLIALSLGIGTAAYNSSSNILFITLSLLLACLILSGVLSWLNLRGVRWRLRLAPPLRVGQDTAIGLELRNRKGFLPTYGLWFEFLARSVDPASAQRAESTITGRDINVREVLAQVEKEEMHTRLPLGGRLDAGGEAEVEWVIKPEKRGHLRVELSSVGSLFPFGFLRKEVGISVTAETVVWPAPIEYRRHPAAGARRMSGGERLARAGTAADLLALRRYTTGDSHRLIHWKASARTRQLLVRQFAAESAEGYSLWLRTDGGVWTRPEQFEVLISFAATLAEDLFRAGRLQSVAVNAEPPIAIRRVHDLELFFDRLSVARPDEEAISVPGDRMARQNLMTFAPDGARGVAAYLDGQLAASA
jgi:uncharacterized protein (DUF58 family)